MKVFTRTKQPKLRYSNEGHLFYIDVLRCFATIAVVSHHTGIGNNSQELSVGIGIFLAVLNWCVPVFCMITGALQLEHKKAEFTYRNAAKYLLRILSIIVFWGLLYNLISLIVMNGFSSIGRSLSQAALMVITADTTFVYQFWYLYMLIGVYLILPIVSRFLLHSSKAEHEILLLILIGFSIVYNTLSKGFSLAVPKDIWFSAFAYFTGYLVYFLIGFWLCHYGISKHCTGFILLTTVFQLINVVILLLNGSEHYSDFSGYYLSILTCELSVLVFMFGKFIAPKLEKRAALSRIIKTISNYSLGIYILHVMVLQMLRKLCGIDSSFAPLPISLPVLTLLAIVLSMIGVWIIKKVPFLRELI